MQRAMRCGIVGAALAAITLGSAARADEAPAAPKADAPQPKDAAKAQPAVAEVTVTAKRPEVVDRIDRRTYDIAGDPQSQSGVVTDILRKLPSITVAPDGGVALRGDTNVTILIDGKPPLRGVLSRLPANQIDKVEVMTNPSAQYAPDGTAGIINIITRRKGPPGLSGGANTGWDTDGSGGGGSTANLNLGKWTLTGGMSGAVFHRDDVNTSHQETLDGHGGVTGTLDETSRTRARFDFGQGQLRAAYRLSEHATLSLTGEYSANRGERDGEGDYDGSIGVFSEITHSRQTGNQGSLDAAYDYVGPHNGETFSLDVKHTEGDGGQARDSATVYSAPGPLTATSRIVTDTRDVTDFVKGDYARGFGGVTLLTAGFQWRRGSSRAARSLVSSDPALNGYDTLFEGVQTQSDLYATYQFPLGKWSVLPGLRVEEVTRRFAAGAPGSSETYLFPSLHLGRDLGGKGRLKLSYSGRLDRRSIQDYDATIHYAGPRSAYRGNPGLKPQTVDSFEASYSREARGAGYIVSLYYRAKHNTTDNVSTDLGGGVILSTWVNAGDSQTGGAELTLHGPFAREGWAAHWKYSVNVNLYDTRLSAAGGTGTGREAFSWSGNATLEYAAIPNGSGGDRLQFDLNASSRQIGIEGSYGGYVQLDASYRHPFNSHWSVVVSVNDLLNSTASGADLSTPLLRIHSDYSSPARALKVALVWKFGG
ncbi:MAG: hypothetical protein JWP35_647 [Caulobacter sp.]|nr:hypothetical protein [Caulobacter sp.]